MIILVSLSMHKRIAHIRFMFLSSDGQVLTTNTFKDNTKPQQSMAISLTKHLNLDQRNDHSRRNN